MRRANHKQVEITSGFWKDQMDKIKNTTTWDILTKFENDHEQGIMQNYEWVINDMNGEHIGPPWYDGLICEVIRGVSDIIAITYDEKLDDKIKYYTSKISKAQDKDKDGYINTYTTLICPDKRWGENGGSLIWQHELYNIGALVEAGVHYYLATGNTELLKCSVKATECMVNVIGEAPRKNIVPAHSLPEEAVVKLYRLFNEDTNLKLLFKEKYEIKIEENKYLELVKFWLDNRGKHSNRASYPKYMGEYAQDHCTIENQDEAVGHAVRAALFYTGLATYGLESGDEKYLEISNRIWNNVELTKMHVSGGIGAIRTEERFGYQYDLPNNAYLETCAGVALAFWAGELFLQYNDRKYMDVFERALYNNIIPALSIDGTHYFYENPLLSDGSIERWDWHGCPCCPPMFLKLTSSIQDYIYTYDSKKIMINLHMSSKCNIDIGNGELTIEQKNCEIPYGENSSIIVSVKNRQKFALNIVVPTWSKNFTVICDGDKYTEINDKGYVVIEREWDGITTLSVSTILEPIKIEAHPYVAANTGRVALFRGPLMYCLEEIDNPHGVEIVLNERSLISNNENHLLLGDIVTLQGNDVDGNPVKAIPYYLWNNRGKGKMNVWLRQEGKQGVQLSIDNNRPEFAAHHTGKMISEVDMNLWENKLYRKYEN